MMTIKEMRKQIKDVLGGTVTSVNVYDKDSEVPCREICFIVNGIEWMIYNDQLNDGITLSPNYYVAKQVKGDDFKLIKEIGNGSDRVCFNSALNYIKSL